MQLTIHNVSKEFVDTIEMHTQALKGSAFSFNAEEESVTFFHLSPEKVLEVLSGYGTRIYEIAITMK